MKKSAVLLGIVGVISTAIADTSQFESFNRNINLGYSYEFGAPKTTTTYQKVNTMAQAQLENGLWLQTAASISTAVANLPSSISKAQSTSLAANIGYAINGADDTINLIPFIGIGAVRGRYLTIDTNKLVTAANMRGTIAYNVGAKLQYAALAKELMLEVSGRFGWYNGSEAVVPTPATAPTVNGTTWAVTPSLRYNFTESFTGEINYEYSSSTNKGEKAIGMSSVSGSLGYSF